MFETDKAMFDLHQKQVVKHIAAGWDVIEDQDRSIIPLLDALNKHPDINTRWCCSGHPSVEEGKRSTSKNGYIAMSVRGKAATDLLEFYVEAMRSEKLKVGQKPIRHITLNFDELWSDINDLSIVGHRPKAGWAMVCLQFRAVDRLPVEMRELLYREAATLFESFLVKWGHA